MKSKNKKTSKKLLKQKAERARQAKRKLARQHNKTNYEKPRASYFYAVGRFSGSKSGYGFVSLEESDAADIFIPASKARGAIDGDSVKIRYKKLSDSKTEGEILEIVAHERETVIGTLDMVESGFRRERRREFVLVPDDKKVSLRIVLRPSSKDKIGDKIEVMLPKKRTSSTLYGEIIRNFGASSGREANYEAILADCEIPVEFSPEAETVANEAAAIPLEERGRKRLNREIIFTIDGADAKDLDDAVSLSRLPNGRWLLGVHIADVSHYVREKTALDREVMKRGTSVYFVDKVVPMLPKVLSNGVCSLNAGEDKYALSAHITLSSSGVIEDCRIEKTIIRSRVRGVYSEVNSLFEDGKNSPYYSKYREVYSTLTKMYTLYGLLSERNKEKGSLELESAEAQIILNEQGEPVDIKKSERGRAERLIEAFMICANEAVATLLNRKEIPCVYRVHESPPKDKLDSFINYASNLGLSVIGLRADDPSARELSSVLEEAKEKGMGNAVSVTLLRTMAKAKYSDNNSLHYGLGLELYCHFTSPIRRLSDLATHRIISEVLIGKDEARKYRSYAKRAAVAASEAELRALSAERQIEALYKTIYMSRFVGDTFDAVVSSVTKFGLFAELDNTCEGLIPIHALDGYYYYDEERKTLSNGKKIYSLGDRLKIRVENADISARTVEFSLAE